MEKSDIFWADDIFILFDKNRLVEFFPSQDMTFSEKLNSIVRFSIYLSIILIAYKKNFKFLTIPVIIGSITIFLSSFDYKEHYKSQCKLPSINNPFMNVLPTEDPKRKKACDINDPKIKEMVKENFEKHLYRDVNDPFDNKNSQRQFYTMPWTTVPNDQKSFSQWLYKNDSTCKEDNNCKTFKDLRQQKPLLIYDNFQIQQMTSTRINPN